MQIPFEVMQTDALVIGSGLAGLMSARSLNLPAGMRLSILSMGSGASPYVHGFNLPLHEDDSIARFIDDTLISGSYQGNRELVEVLCGESLALLPLLEEMGIQLDREGGRYALLRPLGASVPRVAVSGKATGASIMSKIKAELKARGNVTIHDSHRALRFMVDKGAVRGVLAYDAGKKSFVGLEAKVVILATGGFCNIYPFSTNTGDIGGDGIAMAYEAGVPLVDLEFVQFEPSTAVYPPEIRGKGMITTMIYDGAVLRNKDGERFMLRYGPEGERVNKDVMARLIYQEIQSGKGTEHGGVYFDATAVGAEKLRRSYPMYVKRYEDCGIDLAKEYIELAPAPHTSLGGVVISPDCSTSLSGLFACGEIVGGIHGANRIGGNAGLETLVFGKRAGEAAGLYLKAARNHPPSALSPEECQAWLGSSIGMAARVGSPPLSRERMAAIRARMEQLLSAALNVVRHADDLKPAAAELAGAISELDRASAPDCVEELFTKLRLRNDLITAYLLARAALERTESVGCHVRADSGPGREERYRVLISKGIGGAVLKREPLA